MNNRRYLPSSIVRAALVSTVLAGQTYSAEFRVAERGPNHEVVVSVESVVDSTGELTTRTNSYVRLEDALNYLTDQKTWEPAEPKFTLIPGAATAWKGQTKLTLSVNPNGRDVVQMRLPDGRLMTSHVWGLAYRDLDTGKSVMIAEVQDSNGVQIADDQILYPAALGNIADLRYTISRRGIEQDVVVREQLPPPSAFSLGPNCRVEVITEFTEAPQPKKTRRGDLGKRDNPAKAPQPDDEDESLDFGSSAIGDGKTFRLGAEESPISTVIKNWVKTPEGRTFLIESVPVTQLAAEIDQLPPSKTPPGGAKLFKAPTNRLQALRDLPQKRKQPDQAAVHMQRLAPDDRLVAEIYRPGLVLDYATVSTAQTSITFAGDETYYISGPVSISGSCVMEGGTVIKFDPMNTAKIELTGTATMTWGADAGRPVIFSSKNDDTVGEVISGSTGDPSTSYVGNAALSFAGTATANLAYASFRHQNLGVLLGSSGNHSLKHCQWVHCSTGIRPSGTLSVLNGLFNNVSTVFGAGTGSITAQHLTINQAGTMNGSTASVSLKNSILSQVTAPGAYSNDGGNQFTSATSGVFEATTGGNHYLVIGSPYRNSGITSIDSTLAAELKTLTTYAPKVLTGPITVPTTLVPRALRDIDTPDIGWHAVPADYVVSNVVATASISLLNGVAVIVAGNYGIDLQAGGQLISEGRAERMNRLMRWQSVQEQSVAAGRGGPLLRISGTYSPRPIVSLRFTEITSPSKSGNTVLDPPGGAPFQLLQCEFCTLRSVRADLFYPVDTSTVTITFRNNLFERCSIGINKTYTSLNTPLFFSARNNLFRLGAVALWYDSGTSNPGWTLRDNLFDQSANTLNGTAPANLTRSNNGFTTGTTAVFTGAGDKTGLTADYQTTTGWGNRYYPASGASPSLSTLIDAGQQTREAAGLYHFTVKAANLTKEGADPLVTVDIGYHYVGLNSLGQPNDFDGDGIPDYIEDYNGDSIVNFGESNWQLSHNGTTGVPGLQVFTYLEP